jgi:hypothetical protein
MLFNLSAAVSLLLCIGTLAAWVRSLNRYDKVIYESFNHATLVRRAWIFHVKSGGFGIQFVRIDLNRPTDVLSSTVWSYQHIPLD